MPPNSPYTLEICADSAQAVTAAAGIADRIELCIGLDIGGLTPDHGFMTLAAASGVETHVLIRGRTGDFVMEGDDLALATANIRAARQLGLSGVVIGAEKDGKLDRDALKRMISAADGMHLTLHRVIDVLDDPVEALEGAIDLGFGRVLTSGGAASAPQGQVGLRQLHAAAAGRIEIMAGGGLNSATLPGLLSDTPITSFHASCTAKVPLDPQYAARGFGAAKRRFDKDEAQKLAALLREHAKVRSTA